MFWILANSSAYIVLLSSMWLYVTNLGNLLCTLQASVAIINFNVDIPLLIIQYN